MLVACTTDFDRRKSMGAPGPGVRPATIDKPCLKPRATTPVHVRDGRTSTSRTRNVEGTAVEIIWIWKEKYTARNFRTPLRALWSTVLMGFGSWVVTYD